MILCDCKNRFLAVLLHSEKYIIAVNFAVFIMTGELHYIIGVGTMGQRGGRPCNVVTVGLKRMMSPPQQFLFL